MITIEVNNGFLDFIPGIEDEFYITKQINDVYNLNTRNSDYTKVFRIPNSPGNRERLGIQANETKPPDRVQCSLFISDLAFGINSQLLINKIDKYYIEVTVLISASVFFSLIPDESIKALDLVDYNFTWDLTGVAAEKANTEGPIFGIGNYYDMPNFRDELIVGNTPSTGFDSFADLWVYGFSFYMKTLLKIIIENAGFVLDETLVSDIDNYANAVLQCPVLGLADQGLDSSIYALVSMETPPQTVTGTTANIDFAATTDPGALWNNTSNLFNIGTTEAYDIILRYDIFVDLNPSLLSEGAEIRIKNDTTVLWYKKFTSSTTESNTIRINDIINSGTTLYAEIFAYTDGSKSNEVTINSLTSLSISGTEALFSRDLVLQEHLPDISQKSLITNFLALSNTVLDIDDPSKSIVLKHFDSIFYRSPQDLTLNYDPSRGHEFSYIPNNYYKSSQISYANYNSLKRSDLIFNVVIDNENVPEIGSIIGFLFEGSDKERLYNRDGTYSPAFRGSLSNQTGLSATSGLNTFTLAAAVEFYPGDFIDISADTLRITAKTSSTAGTVAGNWQSTHSNAAWDLIRLTGNGTRPRIGLVDQSASITQAFSDGDMNLTGGAVTIAACKTIHFDDGLLPEEIYNDHYKNLLDCFNNFIQLQCWLRLDPITFKNLDLTRAIYIQEFASKFYINKLDQWRPNGMVRADLIRINKQDG